MTDLDRAIAAAREALEFEAPPQFNTHALLRSYRDTLRDLLAALDAARGQAVAWCCPQTICDADGYPEESETPYMEWGQARPDWQGQWTPLFAAPPAAVAVHAANVTPMRQQRTDLARLVGSINAAVYSNGDGLSVTEAIGALELAKLELLKEQEQ